METLSGAPGLGLVYSRTLSWHRRTGALDTRTDHVPPHLVRSGRAIEGARLLDLCVSGRTSVPCTCNTVVRRSFISKVGRFKERFLQFYTDHAFYSKLFLAPVLPIEGCWARYRQHPDSSTGTAKRERRTRDARLAFLTWLERYVQDNTTVAQSLRRTIRRELWRCRHPAGDYLLDQLTYLRRRLERLAGT